MGRVPGVLNEEVEKDEYEVGMVVEEWPNSSVPER